MTDTSDKDPLLLLCRYLLLKNEKDVVTTLLKVLEKNAFSFQEYDNLAKVCFKLKYYQDAIRLGEKALVVAYENPVRHIARQNLINVYNHANQPEKALLLIKQCEQVIPGEVDVQLEKAFSLFLMNDMEGAESILIRQLYREDLEEDIKTKIRFNLGTYALQKDEFQKGMRLFLLEGQKLDYWQKAKLSGTFWEGGIQPGRDILLYAEAGIGDEFINMRFMKHLEEYGMNPIWITQREDIRSIVWRNGYSAWESEEKYKYHSGKYDFLWTYPMALPVYLNLTYNDLWYGPYVKPNKTISLKYNNIFENNFRIGIRWSGNPQYDQDLHRSVPLNAITDVIAESLKTFDYSLYSLQRDEGVEELEQFEMGYINNLENYMSSFEETLGIIDNLDIVITSCTSVAHAAASMGKRTFIFVPISAYYLWQNSWGEKSPWYGDHVTVLKQEKPRDWTKPLNSLKRHLNNLRVSVECSAR